MCRAVSDATPHRSLHASHNGGHFWRPGGPDGCRPGLRLWGSLSWSGHDGRSLCPWLWHRPRCSCRIPNQSWRWEKLPRTQLWPFFLEDFEMDNVDLVNIDVTDMGPDWKQRFDSWSSNFALMYVKFFHIRVDTVVMNPPFGTKHNKGLDMKFLQVESH